MTEKLISSEFVLAMTKIKKALQLSSAFCLILSVFINFKFYCFLNGSTPSTPSILTSHSVVLLNVRFRVAFCPCK